MENKEFYFTTGELARLTGLSKQLLIFYDKKNFFTATATGSNGYRYYLLSKYFQLKILITLRKMDIPLEEIYQYLQHGNDEFLLSIYKRKLSEYQEQMKQLQKKSQILEKRIHSMERQPHLILNRIFITELEKERRYYRWDIDMSAPVKDRVSHMAAALRPYLQDENCFRDSILGFILPSASLHQEQPATSYSFLTHYIPHMPGIKEKAVHIMKPGVYLKIHGYGHYGVIDAETKRALLDFIGRNHMKADDYFMVFPLSQYWMTGQSRWIMTTMIRIDS